MGEKDNIILTKSYNFAVRIVKMYQHLSSDNKEYAYKEARETYYWLRLL